MNATGFEVLAYIDAADYGSLARACKEMNRLMRVSKSFVLNVWTSSSNFMFPVSLHRMLHERRLYEIYMIISTSGAELRECSDDNNRSLLDLAVHIGLYNFARWLVNMGFKSDIHGEAMFDCIRAHDILGACLLLSCGIPVDRFRSRDDGLDLITCSVLHGTPAIVDMFIISGVSIPDGILVLAVTTRHSDPSVVDLLSLLLNKGGCDPNSRSITGLPVLHVAINYSPFAHTLVELLLMHGADVNLRDGSSAGGYSALDIASKKRKKSCCELLVNKGAIHSLLFAVESGDVSTIRTYFTMNPVPSRDVVEHLICVASAMGRVESLRVLLDSNLTDLNTVFLRNDITPLHIAACRGHWGVCKALAKAGINVAATAFGGIDLHIFASSLTGSPLWGPGGNLTEPSVRLKTAAELARESGHEKVARMLDYAMIGNVVARKASFESVSSADSGFKENQARDESPETQ